MSEIGDIWRFPTARKLCSYAGLIPSVHSSGGRCYHGKKMIGKPYSGKPNVRFDEGELEIGYG